MTQVNFNDKDANNNTLTTGDVNALKNAINDNEGFIGNSNVSGYFDSNDNFRYNTHFIPQSNANYDLGSAEYKVRHLFLSDNSLWVGDVNKIDASNGTIQSKTRDSSKLPYYIEVTLGGTQENALAFAGKSSMSELTLQDLEAYAQSLNAEATISDIFPTESSVNYQATDYQSIFKQRDEKFLGPEDTQGGVITNAGGAIPITINPPFSDRIVIDNGGTNNELKIIFNQLPKIPNYTFQTSLYVYNIASYMLDTWSVEVFAQSAGDPSWLIPLKANYHVTNLRDSINIIDVRLMYHSGSWVSFVNSVQNFSNQNLDFPSS